MRYEERKIINKIAYKVREILDINKDNFDIEEVVKELGGKLVVDPFAIDEACVIKSGEESFEIILDPFITNERRKRFSIAHEIGHLILHMKYKVNEEQWKQIPLGNKYNRNTNIPYSKLEKEANEFAGAFLMPKDRFLTVAEDTSEDNFYCIDKISNRFNVSEEAVKVRGRILGIWE
ncbi:ImmA/IrrE family metallo-endopeptidase [Caldisalinibacter kiritimatiensis]|uniref:IrrE N-terminal-like domain-containing protein n=1 Tax=Caldisalinibacter kiritimatiensis TaxID=1304284 RepID=R1AQD0_9FIRM|nr:ImmA/IrrE family metallo-endopeptidase [Caldisalinibacter kiritimatiensis]EOC99332.1 hypothetical protein L21TH_2590 [Caldisalinibacter kiritimatiensis]